MNFNYFSLTFYQILTIFIAVITVFVALKNYIADIKQKRLQNTIYFIQSFEHNNDLISDDDRKNWNKVIQSLRKSCAKFELSNEIYLPSILEDQNVYENKITASIDELFQEGILQNYGESIINILNALNFIALQTLKGKLDIELINFRLIDYYFLATHFEDKDYLKQETISICKLYKKLKYDRPILRKGFFEKYL